MTKEIATSEPALPVAPAGADFPSMMERAIQMGESGVAALERLEAMMLRAQDRAAELAFNRALAAFQDECPIIGRSKMVPDKHGDKKYNYAPLEDILEIAGPFLRKHGFSYAFDTRQPDSGTEVVCILRHEDGHSVTGSGGIIPGMKILHANDAQNASGMVTTGRRIAFLNVTGVQTRDEDRDFRDTTDNTPITQEQADDLRALMTEVKAKEGPFLKYLDVGNIEELPARKLPMAIQSLEDKRRQAERQAHD